MSVCSGKDCTHESHNEVEVSTETIERNQVALKNTIDKLENAFKRLNRKRRRKLMRENGMFKKYKLVKGVI